MEKRAWAIEQLQKKYAELQRLPKRSDFDNLTMCKIKGLLGPWPRALEAAGLKPPKEKHKSGAKKRRKKAAVNQAEKGEEK